jgi:hypothetical protein
VLTQASRLSVLSMHQMFPASNWTMSTSWTSWSWHHKGINSVFLLLQRVWVTSFSGNQSSGGVDGEVEDEDKDEEVAAFRECGVFEVQRLWQASLVFATHPIPHCLLPSSAPGEKKDTSWGMSSWPNCAQPLHLVI